ncbi:MAG: AAC(3) family N-acetyltransferase [Candidatus Hydrogenedentes bacterium]|nr:AAC(3) family N-acetyltransferase [Candidatus Hydrogenedentota bacterium]
MVTPDILAIGLRALGLRAGDTVLVHVALSRFGWVCGGAQAVVLALQEVITEAGTLVMPAHSAHLSEPSLWRSPPVPEEWWEDIREEMPAYQRECTPTWGMGQVAECFRTFPAVLRSDHPHVSFAAWGKEAHIITGDHELELGLGEGSPLARIHERDGRVLLLGVSHRVNTSLHLAEHRAEFSSKHLYWQGAPVIEDGRRTWREFEELAMDTDDFQEVGAAFDESGGSMRGSIGLACCRLMSQPRLVDFAQEWFSTNRR